MSTLISYDYFFIFLEEKKEGINNFSIGYMINPNFNINKSFIEQVDKSMNNTFGPITQPHIRATLTKYKTRVFTLLIFYETRKNTKKAFKVLSCAIYTIIINYVCFDYLACEPKKSSELLVGSGGFYTRRQTF